MKTTGFIQAAAATMVLLASSCAGGGFTTEQRELIGRPGDGIMKLMLTDNEQDSLFLRRPSAEITSAHVLSEAFAVLKERMLATVLDPDNRGVGIAAPQVGIPLKLIIVQRFDKEGQPFEYYINPRITRYSPETSTGLEGCLSVPDINSYVERPQEIEIAYVDAENLETVTENITGYTAVIFQHEIDHLDGILFIDRKAATPED